MTQETSPDWNRYSFAFYNVENLFDTKDNPNSFDDDFTPKGRNKWNKKRLHKKLTKLGRVISSIGCDNIKHSPVLVGMAEVENRFVLDELVASKFLQKKNYGVVHFESPDERGIDTALLYRKEYVTIETAAQIPVHLTNERGEPDHTRDILYVKATLEDQSFHILVNHWPSRRAGAEATSSKRVKVAQRNRFKIEELLAEDREARIIIMGDFNDDPTSESVQVLKGSDFHNPMEQLLTRYAGSLSYRGNWNLFDQMLVSHNFLQQHGNQFRFDEAKIFNPLMLQEYKGRNKGNPFRTFVGRKYIGGISDHFPVYNIFSVKLNEKN